MNTVVVAQLNLKLPQTRAEWQRVQCTVVLILIIIVPSPFFVLVLGGHHCWFVEASCRPLPPIAHNFSSYCSQSNNQPLVTTFFSGPLFFLQLLTTNQPTIAHNLFLALFPSHCSEPTNHWSQPFFRPLFSSHCSQPTS